MTKDDPRPVYFLSDSTGITAETLGNTLLTQFPANNFDRITVPFITTVEQAGAVVRTIDELAATGPRPIVFSTAVSSDIRQVLRRARASSSTSLGHTSGSWSRPRFAGERRTRQGPWLGQHGAVSIPDGRRRIRHETR